MDELYLEMREAVYKNDAIQLERAISGVESELVKNAHKTITLNYSRFGIVVDIPLFHIAIRHLGLLKVICNHLTEDHLIELLQLQDYDQLTPLHLTINDGEDGYKCLKVLLGNVRDDNALINLLQIKDCYGCTPLHYGCPLEIARYMSLCLTAHQIVSLLKIQDIIIGDTPLHRAAGTGSLITWCNLIPANSLIMVLSIQNDIGKNAFHEFASLANPYNVVDKIRHVSSAELQNLLDQKDNHGLSAIDIAMSKGHMTEWEHHRRARLFQDEQARLITDRLENKIDGLIQQKVKQQERGCKRRCSILSANVKRLTTENSNRNSESKMLKKKIRKGNTKRKKLEEENSNLKNMLAGLASRVDQCEQKLHQQTVSTAGPSQISEQNRTQLSNHENSLRAQATDLQQLTNDNHAGQDHNNHIGEQVSKNTNQIDQMKVRLGDLVDNSNQLTDHRTRLAIHDTRLAIQSNRLTTHNSRLDQTSTQVTQITEHINQLSNQVTGHSSQIEFLNTQQSDQSHRIEQISTQHSDFENNLAVISIIPNGIN